MHEAQQRLGCAALARSNSKLAKLPIIETITSLAPRSSAFQYPAPSAGVLALPADRRSRCPPWQARMAVLASSATPDFGSR